MIFCLKNDYKKSHRNNGLRYRHLRDLTNGQIIISEVKRVFLSTKIRIGRSHLVSIPVHLVHFHLNIFLSIVACFAPKVPREDINL